MSFLYHYYLSGKGCMLHLKFLCQIVRLYRNCYNSYIVYRLTIAISSAKQHKLINIIKAGLFPVFLMTYFLTKLNKKRCYSKNICFLIESLVLMARHRLISKTVAGQMTVRI